MTANSYPTLEECGSLHARLAEAEKKVEAALADLPESHPLSSAARELLGLHDEVRGYLRSAYEGGLAYEGAAKQHVGIEAKAAIEIEKDAHTLKPEFKDVVKALFMWKDAPEERVKGTEL